MFYNLGPDKAIAVRLLSTDLFSESMMLLHCTCIYIHITQRVDHVDKIRFFRFVRVPFTKDFY